MQNLVGVAAESAALIGQANFRAASCHQFCPHLFLQLGNMLADSRLAYSELPCCRCETAVLSNGLKYFQSEILNHNTCI